MATKFFNSIRARFFSSPSDTAIDIGVSGDSSPRISFDAGGRINWGTGASTADTTLYRNAIGELKTDGTLKANRAFVRDIELDPLGSVSNQSLVFDGTKFIPKNARLSINQQTGESYTLTLSDDLKMIESNTSYSFSVVIPSSSSVAFSPGTTVYISQIGTGKTVLVTESPVTVNGLQVLTNVGPYSVITLVYRGSNSWIAFGAEFEPFTPLDLSPVLLLDAAQA